MAELGGFTLLRNLGTDCPLPVVVEPRVQSGWRIVPDNDSNVLHLRPRNVNAHVKVHDNRHGCLSYRAKEYR